MKTKLAPVIEDIPKEPKIKKIHAKKEPVEEGRLSTMKKRNFLY